MVDAEQMWVVAAGGAGLVMFAAGSMLTGTPRVDAADGDVVTALSERRGSMLVGSVLSISGCALLLWPLAAVADSGAPVWDSLALFALALWVLGFAMLVAAATTVAALAWREPATIEPATLRLVLDGSHLATWSVSAPLGAMATVATTAVGVQASTFGWVVVLLAIAKVLTVVVEAAGMGVRSGWNAGGWALGSSGYVTVAWFAAVLVALG